MQRLAGRIAFISGGASGIGLCIARALIATRCRVVLADIDAGQRADACASLGPAALAVALDVTDRSSWARAKAEAEARCGPVDILVNNAGIASDGRMLADMDPASFDRVIGINLVGAFNGISAFAASMRDRGEGHILNTASMSGLVADARLGGYCASKFGVVALSGSLRKELAPFGVGVSVLCPGLVSTRLGVTTVVAGSERHDMPRNAFATGMDPAIVARRAVAGIRDNAAYIFTHADTRPRLDEHVAEQRTALDVLERAEAVIA